MSVYERHERAKQLAGCGYVAGRFSAGQFARVVKFYFGPDHYEGVLDLEWLADGGKSYFDFDTALSILRPITALELLALQAP